MYRLVYFWLYLHIYALCTQNRVLLLLAKCLNVWELIFSLNCWLLHWICCVWINIFGHARLEATCGNKYFPPNGSVLPVQKSPFVVWQQTTNVWEFDKRMCTPLHPQADKRCLMGLAFINPIQIRRTDKNYSLTALFIHSFIIQSIRTGAMLCSASPFHILLDGAKKVNLS